ncbi:hypothetical protein ALC57_18551 [Trachymyrmex cornetzi]|uniref:Uncharacterized protein n=1 Tax=Trachymyrmex cornetzi TaxID=471704 RepID=A0A151IRK6_9HYME|nr:hypothetical protein ALC57_18551 [Trachymyrmex cornetzi]
MTSETPKVEFALGSEVSPGRFFKSAFARNFISSGRDCKSLDYELLDNVERNEGDRNNNGRNNNFFSLVNFADGKPANGDDAAAAARTTTLWEQPKPKEAAQPVADANELEKLRKLVFSGDIRCLRREVDRASGTKFVRKEEINLSDRPRCYFIYSIQAGFLHDVLGTAKRNLMERDVHVSKY